MLFLITCFEQRANRMKCIIFKITQMIKKKTIFYKYIYFSISTNIYIRKQNV